MSETVIVAIVSSSAALLGVLLTAIVSLGVVKLQERQRGQAAEAETFSSAAQVVLSKGLTMIDRVQLLTAMARSESKPDAGLAVALGLRRPADRARLLELMVQNQEQIRMAGAQVATYADQETVALCNGVSDATNAVARALLPVREAGWRGQVKAAFVGLPEPNVERAERAVTDLVEARRQFADRLRELHERPAIDVYAKPPRTK